MQGATVDGMASWLADAMMSTAANVAPRPKEKIFPRGWCASGNVQQEVRVTWEKREEIQKQQRGEPKDPTLRNDPNAGAKHVKRQRASSVNSFFEEFVSHLETRNGGGGQVGFYKQNGMKGPDVDGKRAFSFTAHQGRRWPSFAAGSILVHEVADNVWLQKNGDKSSSHLQTKSCPTANPAVFLASTGLNFRSCESTAAAHTTATSCCLRSVGTGMSVRSSVCDIGGS